MSEYWQTLLITMFWLVLVCGTIVTGILLVTRGTKYSIIAGYACILLTVCFVLSAYWAAVVEAQT